MLKKISAFIHNESGATMVEYGLMLALIAVICIGAVTYIGQQTNTTFNAAGDAMSSANNG
ncbi:MAG: Flp family type IVb pilin [Candidatus Sedimenticola endophacoides]